MGLDLTFVTSQYRVCVRLFTATVDQDGGRVRDFDLNVFERTRLSNAIFQFVSIFYVDKYLIFGSNSTMKSILSVEILQSLGDIFYP